MTRKVLALVKQEHKKSRLMSLLRCTCGVEKWSRADRPPPQGFKSCSCPPPIYSRTHKVCSRCQQALTLDCFYRADGLGNPRHRCKRCTDEENLKWQKDNPEKHKLLSVRRSKNSHARERFGMEGEEYRRILASFGPVCGICGHPETRKNRQGLSLDHCHKTKIIRGALCGRCNSMIGFARDSHELLERAAAYLRLHRPLGMYKRIKI